MLKQIGPYALIAILAFLAYGPILVNGAGFSHPDDSAAAQLKCCGFRPLLALTYQFNQRFGGWMAVNLGLHILATWMLFALAGPIAASIFAVHPMAADAVASVSGRSAELFAISVLAGILIYQRARVTGAILGLFGVLGAMAFQWDYFHTILGAPGRWDYMKQTASEIVFSVIPKMVVPVGLTAEPQVSPYGSIIWIIVLAAWLALIPILLPRYRLAIGLIFLPLAAYLLVPLPNGLYEHRAYLSLAGMAILIGLELRRMPRAAFLIVPAFLVMAEARAFVYSSPVHLWEDAVRQDPMNGRAIVNLGSYYAQVGRLYEAEEETRRAVEVAPDISMGWKNLAYIYVVRGQIGDASRTLDAYDDYRKSHKMKG